MNKILLVFAMIVLITQGATIKNKMESVAEVEAEAGYVCERPSITSALNDCMYNADMSCYGSGGGWICSGYMWTNRVKGCIASYTPNCGASDPR